MCYNYKDSEKYVKAVKEYLSSQEAIKEIKKCVEEIKEGTEILNKARKLDLERIFNEHITI